MGMNYLIHPENQVDYTTNDFPDGLSWFFERSGGWDEHSEFKQLEKILKINLDVFDNSTYPYTDDFEPKGLVVPVLSLISILNELIDKINQAPNLNDKINYSTAVDNGSNSIVIGGISFDQLPDLDTLKSIDWNTLEPQEQSLYPPSNDYISSGQLVNDLELLLSKVKNYHHLGTKNAVLIYI